MERANEGATLLRREIYKLLHHEIISCVLFPGQELREQDLAERFEISRSPVRDALLQLEFEGLVEVHPRRGYRVAPITRRNAEELYDMRTILERECVRIITERCTDEDLVRFSAEVSLPTGGQINFVAYNRQFHVSLARLTNHGQLVRSSLRVISQFDRLITLTLPKLNLLKMRGLAEEHRAVADALKRRDSAGAFNLITRHIESSRERVLTALNESGSTVSRTIGQEGMLDSLQPV